MGLKQLHAGFRSAPRAGSFEERRFGVTCSLPRLMESGDGPGDPRRPSQPDPVGCCTPGLRFWEAKIDKEQFGCARMEEGALTMQPPTVEEQVRGGKGDAFQERGFNYWSK